MIKMVNVFNLSLDDFSPNTKAGLNFESIKWCDKLIEKHPNIKINLFVPSAYCRLGQKPCYLSHHPEWVRKVNDLPENYRINLHGMFHRRSVVDSPIHATKHFASNNDEWQFLNEQNTEYLLNKMLSEFAKSGLVYFKTFRPPGWKISESAARVFTRKGFIIAGDTAYYKKYKNKIPNLKWVSYNWDLTEKCKNQGRIVAYGHTSNWTNNYFNKDRFDLVCDFLDDNSCEFKFIEEFV